MNNNKIKEYSNMTIPEISEIFKTAPNDDIDWALVIYLFRHSKPYYGYLFEEKNVITVGKIAKYFDLEYSDVYKRLNRMLWWVSVNGVYGYRKSFNVCSITQIGIDILIGLIDIIVFNDE